MTMKEIEIDKQIDDLYTAISAMVYVILVLAMGSAGWITGKQAALAVMSGTAVVGFVANFVVTYYRDGKRWNKHQDDFYCRPLDEFPPDQ